MVLTIEIDLNDSLEEGDVLAGVGLSHPGGPREPDEWFPYPNKTVSASPSATQARCTDILL